MAVYKDSARGTWYVSTTVDGQRTFKRGFETKRKAQEYERSLRIDGVTKRIRVSDLIHEYIEYKRPVSAPATVRCYEQYNNWYYTEWFGEKYADQITAKYATACRNKLADKSKNYARNVLSVIKAVFDFGVKFGYVQSNPFQHVQGFKTRRHNEFSVWDEEEFKRFVSAVSDPRFALLFTVMYWTGMRCGEVMALTYADIHDGYLRVNKAYAKYGGVGEPKTINANRNIDLPQFVSEGLKRARESDMRLAGYSDSWYVFGGRTPVPKQTMVNHFKRAIQESGVKPIRLHDLRHSHASWLIAHGYNLTYVSKRLGHSTVSMTLDVYTHLIDSLRTAEGDKIRSISA